MPVFATKLNPRFVLPVLLCLMPGLTAVEVSAQEPAAEQSAAQISTAPVVVDGITLFYVRGVSALTAERRAGQITARIVAVAANHAISSDSLRLSETPNATTILAGDQVIMAVVDADASLEGVNRRVLATVFLSRITETIDAFQRDRSPAFLTRHTLHALAATSVFLIVILCGWRVLRRVHRTLERHYKDRGGGIRIQSFEIIRSGQIWRALIALESVFSAAALLTAAYLYVNFVLYQFPWTRGLANNLFSILISPLQTMGRGLLQVIPDLVFLAILVSVTRYVLILIRLFFTAIENGAITLTDFDPAWGGPTYRLVRVAVVAFALVVAYPYIPGSSSQAFKGVSLFIGVLVSLGSTSLIGNLVAGYTLTYRRAFKAGDRIRIGDHLGDVEQSRMMATYLRSPKNELIVVPNSKIISEEVINYSALARQQGLILHTAVGIGYETPWRQVEAMLLEAAARTPGLLPEPKPFVLQKLLGDFAVTYELNGYCDQPLKMGRVYSSLHQNILDLFNEYGVQIMTPSYESDPKQPKVVAPDRWYAAPARTPEYAELGEPPPSLPKAS